jgi:hypothetical protein
VGTGSVVDSTGGSVVTTGSVVWGSCVDDWSGVTICCWVMSLEVAGLFVSEVLSICLLFLCQCIVYLI